MKAHISQFFKRKKRGTFNMGHLIQSRVWGQKKRQRQNSCSRKEQDIFEEFQIGKGVCQGCIFSLCLFNLYAEYIMRNAGLEEAQAGIKIAGRNSKNLRYADDTTLTAESKAELKSP